MKTIKSLGILALAGICSLSVAGCSTNCCPKAVTALQPVQTVPPPCQKKEVVEEVKIVVPPVSKTKIIIYVCGTCKQRFTPTKVVIYCPKCYPPQPPPRQEQVVYIQPQPCPQPAPVQIVQPAWQPGIYQERPYYYGYPGQYYQPRYYNYSESHNSYLNYGY